MRFIKPYDMLREAFGPGDLHEKITDLIEDGELDLMRADDLVAWIAEQLDEQFYEIFVETHPTERES